MAAVPGRSNIGVAAHLFGGAGRGNCPVARGPDIFRITPQRARTEGARFRLPRLATYGKLGVGQFDVQRAVLGIDGDDIAVAQERDWSTVSRLRSDVADAQAPCC